MSERNGRLDAIAEEHGEPLDCLIPRVLKEEGSYYKAAVRLGVYPNALRNWAKKHGYRLTVRRSVALTKVVAHD